MQVYVVHYSPQAQRKERMSRQLGLLGFGGAVFVTGLDSHALTDRQLCTLYR